MRTYYQVLYSVGNKSMIKRFEGEEFDLACDLCNKVHGILRQCREKIRIDWKGVMA